MPAMAGKYDRIRLGTSHLIWGFDLSDQSRFELFLDEASAIGFEGVLCFDWTVAPWLDRPDQFRALLARRKLDLVGVILRPGIDFVGTDRLCRFIAAAKGDLLVISGRDGTAAEWDIVLPAIERHGEIAARHSVRAVYHHHAGWIAETFDQYEKLLSDTSREKLGVMLECGHATKVWRDHTPAEFFEKHHAEIEYVEFKDWSPEQDLRVEIGRGVANWPAIGAAIRKHGYKGWIVYEQDFTIRPPRVSAAESYAYAKHILGLT
jgi:sugar phosphate isomerase/epimerase